MTMANGALLSSVVRLDNAGGGTDRPDREARTCCHLCHFSDPCRDGQSRAEPGRAGQRGVRHPSVAFRAGAAHSSGAFPAALQRLTQPPDFAPLRVRHL
ncbi:hypothetical protein EK904_000900 [Melospiza melodia maxima]|nr:hypothetical protein EK904_000900 [Melospiza melodia maxima]